MLARTELTAQELKISEQELVALKTVARMLESGEIGAQGSSCHKRFDMGTQYHDVCGTAACIGGWVALEMERNPVTYVDNSCYSNVPLNKLYWDDLAITGKNVFPEQGARAIRNFLAGDPKPWAFFKEECGVPK